MDLAARMWPTPDANTFGAADAGRLLQRREAVKASAGNGNGFGLTISHAALLWQTPGADSFRARGGDRSDEMGLDQQARRMWRSPMAAEAEKGNRTRRDGARGEQVWLTMQSDQFSRSRRRPSRRMRKAGLDTWPLPRTPRLPSLGTMSPELRQECAALRRMGSSARKRLSPVFVERLMGWPNGAASSACSVTAWTAWWLHTRSDLCSRPLVRGAFVWIPPTARLKTPQQLSLFP
ncbi:MAG: hypothetical protein AAF909_11545 [Pseudomonadota bacterium]